MAKVVDLGNGYVLVRGYPSRYARLIAPQSLPLIRKLHIDGYLCDYEAIATLLDMGYEYSKAKWIVAVDHVTAQQWKARLPNARTI